MCGGVHTGVILQGRAPTAVRKYDVVNNSLLVCSKLKRSELVRCASREDWRRIHELSSSGRLLHAPPQYLFSHVYNTINLTEATAVPTHLDNLHLSQYGQHMPMKVESYWYIDGGYTTGCNEINCLPVEQQLVTLHNRGKCLLSVRSSQQFQLGLSYQKLRTRQDGSEFKFVKMHFAKTYDINNTTEGSAKQQTYGSLHHFGYCRLQRSSTRQPIWWTPNIRRRTVYSLKTIVTYPGDRQCNE